MENQIFEFNFIDKKNKIIKQVYARDEKLAIYIIGLYNQMSAFNYVKKRFGYKKIVYVSIDPSVLENQQVDTAEQLLLTRAEKDGKGLL